MTNENIKASAIAVLNVVYMLRGFNEKPTLEEIDALSIALQNMVMCGWEFDLKELHDIAYQVSESMEDLEKNEGFAQVREVITQIMSKN